VGRDRVGQLPAVAVGPQTQVDAEDEAVTRHLADRPRHLLTASFT
jgi:hypothetical protein